MVAFLVPVKKIFPPSNKPPEYAQSKNIFWENTLLGKNCLGLIRGFTVILREAIGAMTLKRSRIPLAKLFVSNEIFKIADLSQSLVLKACHNEALMAEVVAPLLPSLNAGCYFANLRISLVLPIIPVMLGRCFYSLFRFKYLKSSGRLVSNMVANFCFRFFMICQDWKFPLTGHCSLETLGNS